MKLRYIYSACVAITTPDVTILSDPWFTQGAEYGSWFHYPPLPGDPLEIVGKADVIYISHIHSDHYDPLFLKRYLERFPHTELLISPINRNLLADRMRLDGFNPVVAASRTFGETQVFLSVNRGYDYDCDTAMLVVHGDQSIANMNDNRIDEEQIAAMRALCPGGRPTLALLTYAGAGPYPQTYHFDEETDRCEAETGKRQQFLTMYARFCDLLDPVRAMPFAGAYVLAGPLRRLNPRRGIADAVDVLKLPEHGSRSVVLADGGAAEFDLTDLRASATRTEPYDYRAIDRYLEAVPFQGYHYEKEFTPIGDKPLPLLRLTRAAYRRTIADRATEEPWWICLKPTRQPRYIVFNTGRDEGVRELPAVDDLDRRWEVHADDRLLFLLLSGYYHWSNAEGGSHLWCKRVPNRYVEDVHDFLYFLMV